MRDQQVNTFQKGMMTDLGASMPKQGVYSYAENIRIVSDGSGEEETGVVVNVNGNEKK